MKKIYYTPAIRLIAIQSDIVTASIRDGYTNHALSGERRGMDEDYEVY